MSVAHRLGGSPAACGGAVSPAEAPGAKNIHFTSTFTELDDTIAGPPD